jgi:hypothetical protein
MADDLVFDNAGEIVMHAGMRNACLLCLALFLGLVVVEVMFVFDRESEV